MGVTLSIDYGNGARKAFDINDLPEQPAGHVLSLWDVLATARTQAPGLEYTFTDGTEASDRGGRSFNGKITSVDGVDAGSSEWVVFVNWFEQEELNTAEHPMAEGRERPVIGDGDAIRIVLRERRDGTV